MITRYLDPWGSLFRMHVGGCQNYGPPVGYPKY